jgi:hypothetical protein
MNEPTAWRWIEAWRNGTISDTDFCALQKLLREEPEARRTLRRYMAMDTALRDRAEAQALIAVPDDTAAPSPMRFTEARPARFAWREVAAWSTAAACLLVAAVAWFSAPAKDKGPQFVVESKPMIDNTEVQPNKSANEVLTIAEQREQLLATAPDVLHLQLVTDNGEPAEASGRGDIVWSSGQQLGYLRLRGLPRNDPLPRQYQLWIVGSDVSGNEIINGGIFAVDQNTGELILPIQADQFVQQPKMFVVNIEPSGGGTALAPPLLATADRLWP